MTSARNILYALLICALAILLLAFSNNLVAWYSDGESVEQSASAGTRALPQVQLLAPVGGEVYRIGDVQAITWRAVDPEGANLDATIYLSADSGQSWQVLEDDIPSVGQFNWAPKGPAGDTYRIKVRVIASQDPWRVEATDDSGADFALIEPPPPAAPSTQTDVEGHTQEGAP